MENKDLRSNDACSVDHEVEQRKQAIVVVARRGLLNCIRLVDNLDNFP
jgi:hypothetical protein